MYPVSTLPPLVTARSVLLDPSNRFPTDNFSANVNVCERWNLPIEVADYSLKSASIDGSGLDSSKSLKV